MRQSWLANTDPGHAWEHQAWPEFSRHGKEDACAVLPCFPLGTRTDACPFDQDELDFAPLLISAFRLLEGKFPHLILPPLRQAPIHGANTLFSIDFETGHALAMAIARSVQESGLKKLVFVHPGPLCAPFLATVAIDARAAFGLDTYVIDCSHPDLSGEDTRPDASLLASAFLEIRQHRRPALKLPELIVPAETHELVSAPFPAYRRHYIASLKPAELRAAVASGVRHVILPTASIEQHSHHLPVGVDSILGQAFLEGIFRYLPLNSPILVAPPLTYGKSNEHTGFPGTVSLDAITFRRLALDQIKALAQLGFTRIHILNTHGGNTAVLNVLLQELAATKDLPARVGFLRSPFRPELPAQEAAWGMHADDWETSLMLACAPHLVRMDRACREYPADIAVPGLLQPEKAAVTFAWLTSDVSESGVMGDATAATRQKGLDWLEIESRTLAEELAISFPKT